jgi:hypothetical protein
MISVPCGVAYAMRMGGINDMRYCACGCGEQLKTKRNDTKYIMGHQNNAECNREVREESIRRLVNRSQEVENKRRMGISKQRKGTHGYGRAARDNPEHSSAKYWVILSPDGVEYEFNNLESWCRNNEHLFEDRRPYSKLPLWRGAQLGINGLMRTDGKEALSWYDWRVVTRGDNRIGECAK